MLLRRPGRTRRPLQGARGGRVEGELRESALALLVRAEVEWAIDGPTVALETVRAGRDLAERRGVIDMVFCFDALSLGALFDLGAWDELLQVANDIVRTRARSAGIRAALAQPWITQVLLWRDRHAEASERRRRACGCDADPRRAGAGPAWVATALVAIHQGGKRDALAIVEELDRESEVSLAWYLENFLADLVRICAASDDLALARQLVDRSRPTATRHQLSLLSATAALEEARGTLGRPPHCTSEPSKAGATTATRSKPAWPYWGPPGASRSWVTPDGLIGAPEPRRSSAGCKPNPRSARRHPTHADLGAARATDVSGHRGQ